MSPRSHPRAVGEAVRALRAESAPRTLLAAAQTAWRPAVGARIADRAQPLRERGGELTVGCLSATWAQELDLLQMELLERLNRALQPLEIASLRFVVCAELG